MPRNDVNYFGAEVVVGGHSKDENQQESLFDSPAGEQLNFGEEFVRAGDGRLEIPVATNPDQLIRGAWVEIDLGAIAHNVQAARRSVGNRRQLMAVVKADAYGHGAPRVAATALEAGADRLAVATVEEGIELRKSGITAPIQLLSQPVDRAIPYLLNYHITPSIYTTEFALLYGEIADKMGQQAPFHLAVNTGMNRIGVLWSEVVEFIQNISFHRALKYEGTFTHFATADCEGDWDFKIQLERFNQALDALEAANISPGLVHAANSAALFRYPEARFDMVRLGISMYGIDPSDVFAGKLNLRPAMSVKARLSNVQEPAMGEGVSYGLHYRVGNRIAIGTIPIGYADGLRRELSGRMRVLCNGRVCRQVGNICMDQCMIEIPLSHAIRGMEGGAEVGDEVVILGEQDGQVIDVYTMAAELNTIPHEITCLFGLRLPRIYV